MQYSVRLSIPVEAVDEAMAVDEFIETIATHGLRTWVYGVTDEDGDLTFVTGDGAFYEPGEDADGGPTGTQDGGTVDTALRTSFGDGTWEIGVDVAPGVYVARPPHDGYWARLEDLGGGEIIANNNVSAGSHVVVEIKRSDRAFESVRCGTWVRRNA